MTIIKDYISELDQFLQTFDQKNPEPSKSQRYEKKLKERIERGRDKTDQDKNKDLNK